MSGDFETLEINQPKIKYLKPEDNTKWLDKLIDNIKDMKNKKSKVTIYVSGMSAKSRGYDEKLLDGYSAEFVMPDVLIEESIKADSVLCY